MSIDTSQARRPYETPVIASAEGAFTNMKTRIEIGLGKKHRRAITIQDASEHTERPSPLPPEDRLLVSVYKLECSVFVEGLNSLRNELAEIRREHRQDHDGFELAARQLIKSFAAMMRRTFELSETYTVPAEIVVAIRDRLAADIWELEPTDRNEPGD